MRSIAKHACLLGVFVFIGLSLFSRILLTVSGDMTQEDILI